MDSNGMNSYLDTIGREALLTVEEEARLSAQSLAGSERARQRLVEANLRFVVKVASEYRGQGLEFDDLVSEGNLGMVRAAERFDASHGVRFVSFAAGYIRRQIERAIERQGGVGSPDHGGSVADGSVRGHAVGTMRKLSVDAPLNGRSGLTLLSLLGDGADGDDGDERLAVALGRLSEREARVVDALYGHDDDHPTMAEVAADMGLKRERVRQIRDKAVRKLRKMLRARAGR